jgi:hypothetical protein
MHPLEISPNEQDVHIPTPVRFVASNPSDTFLVRGVEDLNDFSQGLAALMWWAHYHAANIDQNPAGAINYFTSPFIDSSIDMFHHIRKSITDLTEHGCYSSNHRIVVSSLSLLQPPEYLLTVPDNFKEQTIQITSNEDISVIARKSERTYHDIGNVGSGVFDVLHKIRPDELSKAGQRFNRLNGAIRLAYYDMLDIYEKWPIKIRRILFEGINFYPKTIQVSSNYDVWDESEVAVEWSAPWCEALFSNIRQNNERAGAQNVNVRAKLLTKEDGTSRMDCYVDDDGVDPDPDIVAHGFQYGVSHLGGQGIGMAHHADVIEKQYGGRLTLEYRTDERGAHLPGARVHIRLPVK